MKRNETKRNQQKRNETKRNQRNENEIKRNQTLATLGTQDTGRRQSRDTSNIGHTRYRTKTIQRH
jgi:hypothetical protein